MTLDQIASIAEVAGIIMGAVGGTVAIFVSISARRESRATASEKVVRAAQSLLEPMEREIDSLKQSIALLDLRHERDERQIKALTRLMFISVNYIDDLREMLEEAGATPPPVPDEIARWLRMMENEYSNKGLE